MRYLFLPLVLAVLLTSCGYKGPLYLPKPVQTHQSASQPAQHSPTQPRQDASQP